MEKIESLLPEREDERIELADARGKAINTLEKLLLYSQNQNFKAGWEDTLNNIKGNHDLSGKEIAEDGEIKEFIKSAVAESMEHPYCPAVFETIDDARAIFRDSVDDCELQGIANSAFKSICYKFLSSRYDRGYGGISYVSHKHKTGELFFALKIKERYGIVVENLRLDPIFDEKIKEFMSWNLNSGNLDVVELGKMIFGFSGDIYSNESDFKKILENGRVKERSQNFFERKTKIIDLLQHGDMDGVKKIMSGRNLNYGAVEYAISDYIFLLPEIKEAGRKGMLAKIENGRFVESDKIRKEVFLIGGNYSYSGFDDESAAIFSSPEFVKAAKKFAVDKIFKTIKNADLSKNSLDALLEEEIKNIFPERNNPFKSLPISDEILSSDYHDLALDCWQHHFIDGDKAAIEQIGKKFLPKEDLHNLIETNYINLVQGNKWDLVAKLKNNFSECRSIYNEFLGKQLEIAKNGELPMSERRLAFDALAGLANAGETDISDDFAEIIAQRSKQKEIPESKWGLDPVQTAAFYTLKRLDNPDSNEALFGLLPRENVDSVIKKITLNKLLEKNSSFFDGQEKDNIKRWYNDGKKLESGLDWRDMEFVEAIRKIPSKELRDKSIHSSVFLSRKFRAGFNSEYEEWKAKYGDIPQDSYLQTFRLSAGMGGKDKLLGNFQNLFSSIKNSGRDKTELSHAIIGCLGASERLLKTIGDQLAKVDFESSEDAGIMTRLLKIADFLDKLQAIKNSSDIYDDSANELPEDVTNSLSGQANNLDELFNLYKDIVDKEIFEILPYEGITAEKIEAVEKQWGGDLEPVFTYLGRFPQLKEYIAQMVSNMDSQENWQNWRYDLENEAVDGQIGFLAAEQLEIWKENHFAEMGEIMLAQSGMDKPKQIQGLLHDTVMRDKHIFNSGRSQNGSEFIQNKLEAVFAEIDKSPDKKDEIISNELESLSKESKNLTEIIAQTGNLKKISQAVNSILLPGREIFVSAKTKTAVNSLLPYLPDELKNSLESNLAEFERQGKINTDNLVTGEMRQALEAKLEDLKNLEQYQARRQELQAAIDLLRLCGLNNKLIAINKIAEKAGKKSGETITKTVERLKKYFKNSPLLQDLENIDFTLSEKMELNEKRRLAMVFTDDPQMLWQVGKYPLGCGSCQHYAEGDYADDLMGYVGDADCKVAYLIDLNKLPLETKKEIDEKGFEAVKDNIPKKELLEASIARAIAKMTRYFLNDADSAPAILLEPTYTVVNKGDSSMDNCFDGFIKSMVADSMKAKIGREGGREQVQKSESRSPEGQYEDLHLDEIMIMK